jgi:hypothetical protein
MDWLVIPWFEPEKLGSGKAVHWHRISNQIPAVDICKQLVVMLNTINPSAGFWIEFRWLVVNRGGKNPLVVSSTSKIAEESGIPGLLPIRTP